MAKLPECSEYVSAIETPQLFKAAVLQGGHVEKCGDTVIRYAGGFCVVFPFVTESGKYAIRCWHASVANAQQRTKAIAEELHRLALPYFVGFEYYPDGILTNQGVQPIVAMDWVEALPLKEYLAAHLHDANALRQLSTTFLQMVKTLHSHGISHGDLQHGNILVKPTGELVLVDYDSMYVSALEGMFDDIKGLEGYQHPARWKNEKLSPKADYFSEFVIYTSILALAKYPDLWTKCNIENTDTLLFTAWDITSNGISPIFTILEADSELSPLCQAMRDALACNTIDDIKPLESALVHPVDEISAKWANNGYVAFPAIDNSASIADIASRWGQKSVTTKSVPDTNNISKKW